MESDKDKFFDTYYKDLLSICRTYHQMAKEFEDRVEFYLRFQSKEMFKEAVEFNEKEKGSVKDE